MAEQNLGLAGLEWRPNLVAHHSRSTIYVIESVGGGVCDTLFFTSDEPTDWFDLHVGQIDRLTFFGPPDKLLYGSFVDCREGSKTLHKRVDITFAPDPTRHLFIERGIGYRIANRKYVTVRMENLWFADADNPHYDMFNDDIVFFDDVPDKLPVVKVNDNPVPAEAMQYVLARQQAELGQGAFRTVSSRIYVGGEEKRIVVERKKAPAKA
jgi:hypothetical protein